MRIQLIPILCLGAFANAGGAAELYFTDFSNFLSGPDRIAGAPATSTTAAIPSTDGWTGTHPGQDRSGILGEPEHAIAGIGNAAYIGGNPDPITTGSQTVFVRKAFNYLPVTSGTEIINLRVLAGVQDSTAGPRDDFEFVLYNNNSLGGGAAGAFPLAGLQLDNSQINPQTGRPYQAVYRYAFDAATQTMRYYNTGVTFIYDTLLEVEMRVNFRTNLWSAWLEGLPLFSDVPFYAGPNARNLGSLLVQCRVANPMQPGGNYLLFDDLSVDAFAPEPVGLPRLNLTRENGAELQWYQEAGYTYQVQTSENLTSWTGAAPPAAASLTGLSGTMKDSTAIGLPHRFYRLLRTAP